MKKLEQYQTTEALNITGGTEIFTNGSRQFPTPRTITIVP